MKRMTLGVAMVMAAGLASTAQAQLRISQIYGGGGNTGAQYNRDYVELYNPTGSPVSLSGWAIQYASSAGTTWTARALPAASVPANGYYLIQMTLTGAVGAALPTPDFTVGTAVAMSASDAKVALTNTVTALTGSCPLGGAVVDFVGYGTANCFEGTGAAPQLSNTEAAFRMLDGCFDSNQNLANFIAAAPLPRNSASPVNVCTGGNPDLGVVMTGGVCPLAISAPVSYTITVTNHGDVATDATLTFTFPSNVSFTSSVPAETPSGNTVSTTFAAMAPAASNVFTVNLAGASGGTGVPSVVATSSVTDPGLANNSATGAGIFVIPATPKVTAVYSTDATPNTNSAISTGLSAASNFFFSASQNEVFGRPYESPDHSKIVFRGLSALAATEDSFIAKFDTASPSTSLAAVAQEGITPISAGEFVVTFDIFPSINDSGNVAFSADTGAASNDEVVVKVVGGTPTLIAREGSSTTFPSPVGTATCAHNMSPSNEVMFWHQGPTLTTTDAHVLRADGATAVALEGVGIPGNQLGATTFSYGNFDTGTDLGSYQEISSDNAHYMVNGILEAGATDPEVVVVDGNVVLQDVMDLSSLGVTGAGTVTTLGFTDLINEGGGSWIAYGANTDGQDWVLLDGQLLSQTNVPIATGGVTETFGSSIFPQTFFIVAANAQKDYVIGGITNSADGNNNAAVVLHGRTVLVRENDAVDLDGNGTFDDDAFIRTFRDERALLTNDALWIVAEVRGSAGYCSGNTKTGDALIRIPIPCAGDLDDDGTLGNGGTIDFTVDINDLLFMLDGFEAGSILCDVDNDGDAAIAIPDGATDINDLLFMLARFEAGC